MATQGQISFKQSEVGKIFHECTINFKNIPNEIMDKICMMIIDHNAVTIIDGNVSTNFYPHRDKIIKQKRSEKLEWLTIPKCKEVKY